MTQGIDELESPVLFLYEMHVVQSLEAVYGDELNRFLLKTIVAWADETVQSV